LLDWPSSLFTWDILFLLPVPWVGPVLAPVIVSAAMIAAGLWQLRRKAIGESIHLGVPHWLGILAGAAVVVVSFAMDYQNVLAGGMPHPFHWSVFGTGMAIGVGSFATAARRRQDRTVAANAGIRP
jgi:hypothetical protein